MRNLERILYYESYVVIDPGNSELEKMALLTEEELMEVREQGHDPMVGMGAPVVQDLLADIDIEELSAELRARVRMETSIQRKQEALKRLKVVEAFRQSENRPAMDDSRRDSSNPSRSAALGAPSKEAGLRHPTSTIFTAA